jgi:hypothetical protein
MRLQAGNEVLFLVCFLVVFFMAANNDDYECLPDWE